MDHSFPETPGTVRATLIRFLELKRLDIDARIVRMATIEIEQTDYDNWNGGTYMFAIRLQIPLDLFVEIESQLKDIETRLLGVSQSIWRAYDNDSFTSISISPTPVSHNGSEITPSNSTHLPDFWKPPYFRLFISHCTSLKVPVAALSDAFDALGITGFVAHEDIEPNRKWEQEIESALQTTEALLAIVSDDFCASHWCDQEVGYALGRGVPVIPVRFSAIPHGFIAKIQAIPVPQGKLQAIAMPVAKLLLNTPLTAARMSNAAIAATAGAKSFANAKQSVALLDSFPTIDADQAAALMNAAERNGQVRDAFDVPEHIARIIRRHGHGALMGAPARG
jgi:hypothetical protein